MIRGREERMEQEARRKVVGVGMPHALQGGTEDRGQLPGDGWGGGSVYAGV